MALRAFFTLFLSLSCTYATEYPSSFSQLGTPLYKSVQAFSNYEELPKLSDTIKNYKSMTERTLVNGFSVDDSLNKREKRAYLKELRALQKEYDKLLYLLQKSIDYAIEQEDYELFLKLTLHEFDGLFSNTNNRNRAVAFYKKNRHRESCELLDKHIHDSKLINETLELFKAEIRNSSYSSKSKRKSNKKVRIVAKRDNNKIDIMFENRNIYPVTIRVKQYYKNLNPTNKPPNVIVVDAGSTLEYTSLHVKSLNAHYSYDFSWIMGSKDAEHKSSYIYRLPYKKGTSHVISQGYNGTKTHKGTSAYAIDFPMAEGTKIYAARDGVVVKTKSNSNEGGYDKKYASSGNYVRILHSDGTMATYYHLKYRGVLVHVGDRVSRGFPLGYSGNTGYSSGPHLHFSVFKATDSLKNQTIPIKIVSKEGLIEAPDVGSSYTAY